ncbi:MAG: hypothetical protein K0R38_3779 [Polyangiaceae bacterium]|nr:hypothetical protein [Polyangiaceae bacterium]
MNAGGAGNSGGSGSPSKPQPTAGLGPTMGIDTGLIPVGQLDDPPPTKLPALPPLENVVALQGDDSASITFDPIDGAVDYRVYVLPADGDITVNGAEVVIKDGTYRCAGTREAPPPTIDGEPTLGGAAINTRVDGVEVAQYKRTLPEATLGYVYATPGPGRVPVYALGESDPNADSTCFFARWKASRFKRYTTSERERDDLLKAFARDDGIVFYVPEAADDTTRTVYADDQLVDTPFRSRFYTVDGPEAAAHPDRQPAFQVLSAPAAGAKPLMRVYYGNQCGFSHDELAVGEEAFKRVRFQGDKQSLFSALWTGITKPATLVVEALDAGCPFQGHLSTESTPMQSIVFGQDTIVHQPWLTLADMRAASGTGEVFINGHYDAANKPKAIARSFIAVEPKPHPKMDFLATFPPGEPREEFKTVPCGADNCFQTWRQQSATFDQMFINAESSTKMGEGLFTYGPELGEWWVSYADVAADTNGKYRLTANQKATISADKFLHVTMSVDGYSTARRYPQIIISDAEAPVQYGLETGHSLIIQPRAVIYGGPDKLGDYPVDYELQVCNLRTWDVNNQCPVYDLYHVLEAGKIVRLAPNEEVGEHASADGRILFDVFASTTRAYLFLQGKPYGCANLPPDVIKAGPTTVTWGDALYHSAVDNTFAFHKAHMLVEQRRHFDNLGFSSDVLAPTWDETRFPCAAPIAL